MYQIIGLLIAAVLLFLAFYWIAENWPDDDSLP